MKRSPAGPEGAPTRSRPPRRRRRPGLAEIEAFLAEHKPGAPPEITALVRELMLTAVRLIDDETPLADVKLLTAAARELRRAFRVFSGYRGRRKVTTFGSARTLPEEPIYRQAEIFARRIADEGFFVITGAGGGIMRACQAGAGTERSFGLNIRLPFEQAANEFIEGDPKLVTFKYFFTRKLLFVKESDAVVLFPGGFGTHDEAYEVLTLVQTGKSAVVPIVFLDAPGETFWAEWLGYQRDHVERRRLVSPDDRHLFCVTDDVGVAVDEIRRFYRVFHSYRFVGDRIVLRLKTDPGPEVLEHLHEGFSDLVVRGGFRVRDILPEEERDETARLRRLVFDFDRVRFGRLRQLIDFLNQACAEPGPHPAPAERT